MTLGIGDCQQIGSEILHWFNAEFESRADTHYGSSRRYTYLKRSFLMDFDNYRR